MTTPTIATTPLPGPRDVVEYWTRCRHGEARLHLALSGEVSARAVACAALMHHHVLHECECMWPLWPRYRTAPAPVDLDRVRTPVARAWARLRQAAMS
jgi:hypothetical protein